MRENKQLGAVALINLTSDVWYPDSRLPLQHFYHARLRTVESGLPLLRASNVGITGAIDSLGRIIELAGNGEAEPSWTHEALYVEVPLYGYQTLYQHTGDRLVVVASLILAFIYLILSYMSKRGNLNSLD